MILFVRTTQVLDAEMKLALGFTIALLMSLHHVSAQTLLSTTVLPDTEVNSTMALEEDQGAPSGSGLEPNSGDDLQTVNVTSAEPPVVLVTGTPDDENVTTVSSAFIPFDSNEFNSTDYNSSDPLWPEPSPSAPNMTDVSQSNGTETPLSNSTTVATVSGNLTTTRSPRPGNSTTMSPTNYNSTKTTRPTTVIPSNASVPVTGSDDNKPATEFVTDVNVTGSFIAGEEAGRGKREGGRILLVFICVCFLFCIALTSSKRKTIKQEF